MKFRKALLVLGLSALALTTACSSDEPLPTVMSFNTTAADAAKVVEMIDSITVADMTTEQEIEKIYLAYCNLDESTRELVTNYDKLTGYRKTISELYYTEPKLGSRMDRTKINIGTYCFNPQCWNDEGVQALVDCGIDFIANASYDNTLLDLLDKYGVGAFASGVVPGWYTGGGNPAPANVGTASTALPLSSYETAAANFVDRDCIWGIDLGDEPWSQDIPHFAEIIDYCKEVFPGKIPYLNLLPPLYHYNRGQMYLDGVEIGHIDSYAQYVKADYLSYDQYPYGDLGIDIDRFNDFYAGMIFTSKICNENDMDLWTVIQANSQHGAYLTENQLRMQLGLCLANGVRTITWACWNAGWFDYNIVDSQGKLGDVYYSLQKVNADIDTISLVYSKYYIVTTGAVGLEPLKLTTKSESLKYLPTTDTTLKLSEIKNCSVSEITTSENVIVTAGYFEKLQGEGSAIMFANTTNFWGDTWSKLYWCDDSPSATVYFTVKDPEAKVMAYYNGDAFEPEYVENGQYRLTIGNCDNVFVTIE
ncbi:MAG: hypothetical protein E7481_02780 [Ruminococcaceae bacterium]|nr:hypothetical protein [Oscillospiraceae bacterium]